ncbi:unnamed protein product [Rhizophagus irregularis]|nr:unnamed protein product [Rhizophagus irregularis]
MRARKKKGNQQKKMLQQFKDGLGTDGCIYEFSMAETYKLRRGKGYYKSSWITEQHLTFTTVATKQIKHYALSTTRDSHVKQEIINSLVDHEYEIDADFNSAKRCYDTSSLSLSRKRPLSETDAEDRFEMIAQNTAVEVDLPEDIKEYLHCLLSGNIKNALSEVEKTLDERRPLMNCLWRNLLWAHGIYSTHYMGDITKLAHNEVDDLNYTILQMLRNNSEETQICGIHGYKYLY